jgi:hypothetical protein
MLILRGHILSCFGKKVDPERDFLAVVLIKKNKAKNELLLLLLFFYELFPTACFDSEKTVKE